MQRIYFSKILSLLASYKKFYSFLFFLLSNYLFCSFTNATHHETQSEKLIINPSNTVVYDGDNDENDTADLLLNIIHHETTLEALDKLQQTKEKEITQTNQKQSITRNQNTHKKTKPKKPSGRITRSMTAAGTEGLETLENPRPAKKKKVTKINPIQPVTRIQNEELKRIDEELENVDDELKGVDEEVKSVHEELTHVKELAHAKEARRNADWINAWFNFAKNRGDVPTPKEMETPRRSARLLSKER